MEIEKEQLFRDVNPKMQLEKVSEEKIEEPKEPVVEKETVSETPKKKSVLEKVKEKLSEDEEPVDEAEKLKKEAKETKEELAVIKEVREELVALYAKNKDLSALKEQLSKELKELKSERAEFEEKLSRYVEAEKAIAEKQKLERLEQLSAKFKKLGQLKSVEQLSEKDDETLDEFEKIVDAAIDKADEASPAEEVTSPSQGAEIAESNVEPVKVEVKKEEVKADNKEQFFAGLLQKMAGEQERDHRNSKIQYM